MAIKGIGFLGPGAVLRGGEPRSKGEDQNPQAEKRGLKQFGEAGDALGAIFT